MNNSVSPELKKPVKKCWKLGDVFIVAIDAEIVKKLGVEESTLFEQEITNEGILMRRKVMSDDSVFVGLDRQTEAQITTEGRVPK